MTKAKIRSHKLKGSALYGVGSRRRLAELLFSNPKTLSSMARSAPEMYRTWSEPKTSGALRTIEAPHKNLKALQRRIAELLQRVETPPYLFSPVRGRSYVDNAAHHRGAEAFQLLDVQDFYPSCTSRKVTWFFRRVMCCNPDVVAILRGLTTRHGHLPQGSPSSSILAYFAYQDMWDEIALLVKRADCHLSVYADDITVSGQMVPSELVRQIKRVLRRHGHQSKAEKEHGLIHRPADITGVIVRHSELLLPNRQHSKQRELRDALERAPTQAAREAISKKLQGHKAQAGQISQRNT